MNYCFKPAGVCSTAIEFDVDGGRISNIRFTGGCNGNLKAVAKLADGMDAEKLVALLAGNTCGNKKTSCADQLARAVREALNEVGMETAAVK